MTEFAADPPVPPGPARSRPEAIRAVPLRHPWRWVAAVVVLLVLAGVVDTFITAPELYWSVVRQWLLNGRILNGCLVTLYLTAIAMVVGVGLGVLLAVMRLSPNPVMSWVSWLYIWFFRGTPVLVQLFFWWSIAYILPYLSIGIPFTHIAWTTIHQQRSSPPCGGDPRSWAQRGRLHGGDRPGRDNLRGPGSDRGGPRAGDEPRSMVMRRIVLPQAMRVIIPPTGNETISMLKTTSLASIVTAHELFFVQSADLPVNTRSSSS